MKKITFLAIASYLLVSCDFTPGGNKGVLPVVHEESIAPMPDEHEDHAHTIVEEVVEADTLNTDAPTVEEVIVTEETAEAIDQ